jgi:hypothetical protein
MIRLAVIAALTLTIGGCAAIPLATGLALGTAAISAGGLALTGIHDCKTDGGCRSIPLPP